LSAGHFEIEALRGEFTDAAMMRRLGRLRVAVHTGRRAADAHIDEEFVSREEIRAAIEGLQGISDDVVQTQHPARSSSRATPRSAVHTSQSSGACATAGGT